MAFSVSIERNCSAKSERSRPGATRSNRNVDFRFGAFFPAIHVQGRQAIALLLDDRRLDRVLSAWAALETAVLFPGHLAILLSEALL